jgi:hypothetical protein
VRRGSSYLLGLLAIYLNDHLAGSTAGLELAQRAAANNRTSGYGPDLEQLAAEIREDRESLLEIMRSLGVGIDRVKVSAAWAGEKLARLKLNGRLLGYSPLSRIVELEALTLGVTGKLAMWRALEQLETTRPELSKARLAELITRAKRQQDGLEKQRQRAIQEGLG